MQGLRDPQGAHAGVPGARRLASRACRARPWRSSPARIGAQPPARQAVRLGVHADSTLQQPAPAAAPSSPSAAGLDNKCTIKVRGLPDQLLLAWVGGGRRRPTRTREGVRVWRGCRYTRGLPAPRSHTAPHLRRWWVLAAAAPTQ